MAVNQSCVRCTKSTKPEDQEQWIQCDVCDEWFHYVCVGINDREAADIAEYHCPDCEPGHGPSVKRRLSRRPHAAIDYAALDAGEFTAAFTGVHPHWRYYYQGFNKSFVKEVRGTDLTEKWARATGMKQPVIIRKRDSKGFGLRVPKGLTVRDVANTLGGDEPVEVMRVADQTNAPGWTLNKWADYFEFGERDTVYNVISLEFSHTALADSVTRPSLVRQLDLVDRIWPRNADKPKVSLYCLMSVKGCYTDFHVDFGGSSVFYHVLRGSKTFMLVPPKKTYLAAYEKWCQSPDQQKVFFGDLVGECYQVDLHENDNLIIPSGWIHAVYTPSDSLIIGGNFLTSLNFDKQTELALIEKRTRVPRKFRFPRFQRVLWYWILYALDNQRELADSEIPGLSNVLSYLRAASSADDPKEKKEYQLNVPKEIKDPSALLARLEAFIVTQHEKRPAADPANGRKRAKVAKHEP